MCKNMPMEKHASLTSRGRTPHDTRGSGGALTGTESCLLPHVANVIRGAIEILMDDGSKETFYKGDIMMLPPGHDAWTVGDEPCEFIQMSQSDNYYADRCH